MAIADMLGSGAMFLKAVWSSRRRALAVQFLVAAALLFLFWASTTSPALVIASEPDATPPISDAEANLIELAARFFTDYPLQKPYTNRFGELGGRLQVLQGWLRLGEAASPGPQAARVMGAVEAVAASSFPFLVKNSTSSPAAPLADLRRRFTEPRGIVIPTGAATFRFACHLVVSLRRVLGTALPIQIAYAGDADLPGARREELESLSGPGGHGGGISFLDVTGVFDDATLGLARGGWAVKVFAALASTFAEVILADADAVFLQDPAVLLAQGGYRASGALFFHDRLLWQHAFGERHRWWRSQVVREGPNLAKSLVWTDMYAEEQDSGVVVVDKSRPAAVLGLLHAAWQNTRDVRDEATYRMTYGDKEAWWFGFELAGAPYAFEGHYGGVVGWARNSSRGEQPVAGSAPPGLPDEVCSFVISHVDESDRLLWYNGGLLKNKMADRHEFEVPTHWMMDAEWEKGANKPDMSCMKNGTARELTDGERDIIRRSIEEAQIVDAKLNLV